MNLLKTWMVIWAISVIAFYVIGLVTGYIDNLIDLFKNTTVVDHVLPFVSGAVAALIGWASVKVYERYRGLLSKTQFIALGAVVAVCVQGAVYMQAVNIVTITWFRATAYVA